MTNPLKSAVVRSALLCLTPVTLVAQDSRSTNAVLPSGAWLIAQPTGADTAVYRWTLQFQRDGSITGANPDGLAIRGTVRGDSVTFDVVGRTDGVRVRLAGVATNGVIRGTRTVMPPGATTPSTTGEFLAMRDTLRRAPRLHTFEPRVFHRSFSGAAPAALHIVPGDTVRTWSLDNAGRDSTGMRRSAPGNPLTGPFYIEGALPGDMIAVRLQRVRLNRDFADAGYEVVGNALDPEHLRTMKEVPAFNRRWRLDRQRGVAMLEQPTSALAAFTTPLRPMIGGIGVAPPGGQVIGSTESGVFGGNLDYNEIREGVTVYLPVFQRGALLFVGDGHAVQGDGELTGDALETSMNIEFSVEVFPYSPAFRQRLSRPRAENDEFLMAIGIRGGLSDALRDATSNLATWLETDYQLNAAELGSVLGTSMRYDIAELVGSQVSIVAKLPKTVLRQLCFYRGPDARTDQTLRTGCARF